MNPELIHAPIGTTCNHSSHDRDFGIIMLSLPESDFVSRCDSVTASDVSLTGIEIIILGIKVREVNSQNSPIFQCLNCGALKNYFTEPLGSGKISLE
jgi:hypothetical protein